MKKNKIYLYLDDVRIPTEGEWEVVRNYDEFVAHIKMNGLESYEVISLDHDLGESAMQEYYTNTKPHLHFSGHIHEDYGYAPIQYGDWSGYAFNGCICSLSYDAENKPITFDYDFVKRELEFVI